MTATRNIERNIKVRAIYTASKHAVNGLTRSAALEFAKQGMRVNAVAFGTIQTPMIDRMVVWYFCLCGLSAA
jgi:NAD(P)-dependent dehydrogenase (short-subunit alcohol dehydrogenase family)